MWLPEVYVVFSLRALTGVPWPPSCGWCCPPSTLGPPPRQQAQLLSDDGDWRRQPSLLRKTVPRGRHA